MGHNSSTRTIKVKNILVGGGNRISVQSMTNTKTSDVEKTVVQINELTAAGADIIRFAVLNAEDAEAVKIIRQKTKAPLVADIHFDYRLAIAAMENGVDKIRFNPGNIGSTERVRMVVSCAKQHDVPIRIGVNAGSLDKTILNKFGAPTPSALVESAMQHVRILEAEGFYNIAVSLKTSDVTANVEAYRTISRLIDYPLHIGVTEAGGGELALVKSSIGIGSLLLDGIGDTLRVSLTGNPVNEVYAGCEILRALGKLKRGVEVISCPTCGRCQNIEAHSALVERINSEFKNEKRYLKIAVMGCAVNGPGEAREAELGIAFGQSNAVVFRHGEQVYSGAIPQVLDTFVSDCKSLLIQKTV